ncbi:MAG: tyrosine--tRNA ligase [Candidatus Eisenbacteria bacterium]|nr:tyrosine--tRNA ligase [Candidatus Eisenbacteria bacterium]
MTSARDQLEILRSGTEEILPEKELLQKLERSVRTGKPLRIKQGFDPTAPDIHLGHAVGLRKLKQFQDLGHTIVLIVGNYTALVGDPSGRSATRPRLSHADIEAYAATYLEQFFRVLDPVGVEVVRNGDWFAPMNFEQVMELAAGFTIARLLERDDFEKRFREQRPISLHELFYPIMQGHDSVVVRSDVEIGATEQKFNLLVGRQLQVDSGQEPQVIMTLPILVGLDGVNRMSKSLGNYVGISEPPAQMFGKLMSIPDELLMQYYELTTPLSPAEIAGIRQRLESRQAHPRALKADLGEIVVGLYYGPDKARAAREEFDRVFRDGGLPDDVPEVRLPAPDGKLWIVQLLAEAGLVSTRTEARRLIRQNAVTVDDQPVTSEEAQISLESGSGRLVRVGKRRFARVFGGSPAS